MDYYCYDITVSIPVREIALAFLNELPFDTFEETEKGLRAYLRISEEVEDIERELSEIAAQLAFTYSRRRIAAQNWNAVWEANFQPIQIGAFCGIRADFHPPFSEVQHEIIIQPRMAFGTGHHATTYMMIDMMSREDFQGSGVLDFGCGTGILAILAVKMGAQQVDAVDIEEPAYQNTIENAALNHAGPVAAYHGTLDAIKEGGYNIILANINRNVILNTLSALYGKLAPAGVLLVSGILLADESLVLERAETVGLSPTGKTKRGEWSCMRFEKRP